MINKNKKDLSIALADYLINTNVGNNERYENFAISKANKYISTSYLLGFPALHFGKYRSVDVSLREVIIFIQQMHNLEHNLYHNLYILIHYLCYLFLLSYTYYHKALLIKALKLLRLH